MGYFLNPINDSDPLRQQLWTEVTTAQLQNWPPAYRNLHPLEAKTFFVFTVSRHLVRAVHRMGKDELEGWKQVYIETYLLLFPFIELIGKAVIGGQKSSKPNLQAGFHWLNEPDQVPNPVVDPDNDQLRLNNLDPYLVKSNEGTPHPPMIKELIKVRNYLLHGIAGRTNEPLTMSFQHPRAIAIRAEWAMRKYWQQLRSDIATDGGWIDRLSNADIKPFPIPGSGNCEKCLIDPDIIQYLTEKSKSEFAENKT
jgi:hypothetical protein